jgi:tetratricopeptide (TPR) repeat protein
VLAVALGLRLARLPEVLSAPDFAHPAVDAAFHDWWARSVAGVPGSAGPEAGRDPELLERAYLRPPGYPLALAAVYAVTDGSHLAARLFQLLLGLLTTGLVWLALERAAGAAAALAGGLAIGCHWLPIYFEGELQATSWTLVWLAGATACLSLWFARPTRALALALGLCLGMAAIARSNALVVLAAALLVGALELRRRGARWWTTWALPVGAGAALAILPVGARNLIVAGEPVLISTNGGINLYIGNHAGATGFVAAHLPGLGPFETCFDYPALARRVEARAGRELSDREISAWFTAQALAWIRSEPRAFLALTARKARLLVGPGEIPHNKELGLERSHSRVLARLPFPFPVLLAGGLVGLLLALQRPRGDAARFLAVFAATAAGLWLLSVLPFFVAARYRVEVLPWLALLSGLALVEIVRRSAAPGRAALAASAWVALAGLLGLAAGPLEPNVAKWHHDRGRALLQGGASEAALFELEAALAADPARFEAELTLANALHELGRVAEAEAAYRRVLERRPAEYRALNNLGVLLAERGDLAEAAGLFERALERDPLPGTVHLNLARAREALGEREAARGHYAAALELNPGNREAERALRRLDRASAPGDDAEGDGDGDGAGDGPKAARAPSEPR